MPKTLLLFIAPVFLLGSGLARAQSGAALTQTPAAAADSLRTGVRADSAAFSGGIGAWPVRAPQLTAAPFGTLQAALSQVAGVQVTPYSGAPGALLAVRIRGAASLAGNPQPLYVVDGLPAFQGMGSPVPTGFSLFDQTAANDLNPLLSLAPDDVASVTVLKGALETARYGAQGQNGVVEITTRRGSFGRGPQVRYSGAGGVQQARYRYDLLSAREVGEIANEAAAYRGRTARFSPAQLAALGQGTDWQAELLRPAAVHEHHLSVAGGSANSRAYVGASYLGQSGILENSRLRRLSLLTNLEQRVGARLRLQASALLSQTTARQPNPAITLNTLVVSPALTARDANGELTVPSAVFLNPLRQARQHYEEPRQRRLLGRLELHYELLSGLELALAAGRESAGLTVRGYQPSLGPGFPGGLTLERDDTYDKLTLHPALRFDRLLAGRHQLSASLEAWQQHHRTTYKTREFRGLQVNSLSSGSAEQGLLSYQAQAGYGYAGRYEARASLRRDGSSALAVAQRWRYLPAAQLTWHAGQESGLRESRLIRRLDLWAGWGHTANSGNFFDESYRIRNSFNSGIFYVYSTEHTRQHEAGLRLGLKPAQLDLSLTAYQRQTEVALPEPAGAGPGAEVTRVLNRGLELTATTAWQAGPVRGSSTLAAAYNQNEVQMDDRMLLARGEQRVVNGQPLSLFYGQRYLGTNPATGQARYADTNGDGVADFNDQQGLGSGLPRVLLSFGQQLTYRRLTLLAQVEGQFGHQVFNASLLFLDEASGYNNNSGRVRQRWQPGNRAGSVPAAGADPVRPGTYQLQAGNHARLRSLTLSYRVWERAERSVAVWAGGQNLLLLSAYRGFDPNVSSGGADHKSAGLDAAAYPVARTVSVGVRATL